MRKLLGLLLLFGIAALGWGQAISVNGGSIQGTITDTSGAVVANAAVVVTSTDEGTTRTLKTDKAGFYSVGPLNPGPYTVVVSGTGYESLSVKTVIRTGTVTSGDYKLTVGSAETTIEVSATALQVNTDQMGVAAVISREQIDTLPLNGHNILDVAQLQPGVLLQSGQTFDPTKAGYSAISVGGVSGRTTRILLDGQDITDETVGTTIFNVSTGAIDEFQLNQSTQDVSGEITSTGQVLMSTRSGTNQYHGELFYDFQDYRTGFAATTGGFNSPFQRNNFGGNFGGPIIKDKLFIFADVERIKQDEQGAATTSPTFSTIQNEFPFVPAPFRDTYTTGRMDYNGFKGSHWFARVSYGVNSSDSNFSELYALYKNRDNVPAIDGGVDFVTGRFTHSFRGGYEKFHNLLSDGTAGLTSIYNPTSILGIPVTLSDSTDGFFAGPNYLAPQGTFQSDKQLRYDGTWTRGSHSIKFGASMNRILGGGFAEFYGPSLYTVFGPGTLLPGGNAADPLNGYSAEEYVLGNGNGLFTEKPGFGLSGGGEEDWRSAAYVGDSWKVASYMTIIGGLRWSVDTDRANQDLSTPLCSSVNPAYQFTGCTGNTPLFDQFQAGLGAKTHQPYANFGPQLGFVFSPGDHKTSLHGGIGIFYESDIFNNTSNARSAVVNANGNFFNFATVCGGVNSLTLPNGQAVNSVNGVPLSTICGESIAQAAPQITLLKAQYQAASQTGGPNPSYIGNGGGLRAAGVYAAPYVNPYSIQINGGIEHEIHKGTILDVNYVHNATLKIPLLIDVNHVGAARTLNVAAAQAAIATTLANCGAPSINAAIMQGGCSSGSGPNGNASIVDFARNGLDSGNQFDGGNPASFQQTAMAAFPGVNPNVGLGEFILPVGRSGYDALQMSLREQASHPLPGIVSSNIQISYTLSRSVNPISTANGQNPSDQFFNALPWDFDNPNEFMGRSNLDHTNELSFGGSAALKYGLHAAIIAHFNSAQATSLSLDNTSGAAGEIFRTDVTGDGSTGDLVPGTLPGSYMHEVKGAGLNKLINNYNMTHAGQPTPAGQALITAGLFTQSQLLALNGVQQQIATAPTTPLNNAALRAFDMNFSYPISLRRFREGVSLEPGIALYNVFNMSNFGALNGVLANVADAGGTVGTVNNFLNGPNNLAVENGLRVQRGSGTYDLGAPRSTEFQLKLNF
jgi:Carboxypeptidase regulatory-like domain